MTQQNGASLASLLMPQGTQSDLRNKGANCTKKNLRAAKRAFTTTDQAEQIQQRSGGVTPASAQPQGDHAVKEAEQALANAPSRSSFPSPE